MTICRMCSKPTTAHFWRRYESKVIGHANDFRCIAHQYGYMNHRLTAKNIFLIGFYIKVNIRIVHNLDGQRRRNE